MGWKIEGSNDRFQWRELAAFNSVALAEAVFDLELILEGWLWIRLVNPEGVIQERARTQALKRQS